MAIFINLLLSLTIGLIVVTDVAHSLAYDVAKLNTKMNKMKATLTRHNTKEQSKVTAQALLPKFIDKAKNAVGRLHEEEYTNGFATFELLVRRTQTGPWYRYQDLSGTEVTNDFVENVILGGLEAETWRMKLDNWISMQVFGKGTGSESIKKVKETLIQFKKLKPREFEFGYRIAVDGETVYSVEKSMKEEIFIPKSRSPSMARVNVTNIISNIQELSSVDTKDAKLETHISLKSQWQGAEQDNKVPLEVIEEESIKSSISVLNDVVLQFYDRMVSEDANGCLFFSDGSATLSEDGLGCATACCGVFLLPTKNNIPIYDISESIRVDSAGGMIDSPFDAELIAGLSAVTLAKLIAKIITRKDTKASAEQTESSTIEPETTIDADGSINQIDNGAPTTIRNKIEFTLHTDSKTLCRAIRTGPKGDLADRASPSRLALWKLLSGHMGELASIGLPMHVEWIPGHPERRDMDKNRWTVRDIGIWMADEIAKIEGTTVTAGFVNSKSDISSNNNKLEVRSVEKVAKFPKKMALKSPKKTGVKKKNYYNTKLSFSKDPRNPNVLASANAANATAADVDVDGNLEGDVGGDVDESEVAPGMDSESGDDAEGLSAEGEDARTETMSSSTAEDLDDGAESSSEGDEMEDVEVLEVSDRVEETLPLTVVDLGPTMMPVAIIGATDMIKLSTILSI